MAKCTGPLYSLSASGKLANAMVYFGWKGINVCREWLKPANPQSAAQGNRRLMLGGTGRAVGKVYPNTGHVTISAIAQQLITLKLIGGGQTKQSYLVNYILGHYLTTPSAFVTQLAAFTGHAENDVFTSSAAGIGLVDLALSYDTVSPYEKGLGLYLLAKACCDLGFAGTPYTTAIASWVTADITGFVADMTGP